MTRSDYLILVSVPVIESAACNGKLNREHGLLFLAGLHGLHSGRWRGKVHVDREASDRMSATESRRSGGRRANGLSAGG